MATVTAFFIAGQIAVAVELDHIGFLGLERHPLSVYHVAAVVLFSLGAKLLRRF